VPASPALPFPRERICACSSTRVAAQTPEPWA
jgi:hypothetical protein